MPFEERHLRRQPFTHLLLRTLRNRCPVCGTDTVFSGLFRMRHHCHACTYVYLREPGYFLGAIYLNYGVTCALALALFYFVAARSDLPATAHLVWLLPVCVLIPVLFFRYSRLLWMLIDVSISVPERRDFLPPPGDEPALPL